MCPAVMGKIRCPHRPSSMRLDRGLPEILAPPQQPPAMLHPADHHRPAAGRGEDALNAISHLSFAAEIRLDHADPQIRKRRVQARVAQRRCPPQDVS